MGYCTDSLSNLLLHKTQIFLNDVFMAKSPPQHDRWTEQPVVCHAKKSRSLIISRYKIFGPIHKMFYLKNFWNI